MKNLRERGKRASEETFIILKQYFMAKYIFYKGANVNESANHDVRNEMERNKRKKTLKTMKKTKINKFRKMEK